MNYIKAIIADDEKLARDYIRQLVIGYENIEIIEECKNGLDTVNAVFAKQPDLIFLELQIPNLNGFEVIQEKKKEIVKKV